MTDLSTELQRKLMAGIEYELQRQLNQVIEDHFWWDVEEADLVRHMRKQALPHEVTDEEIARIAKAIADGDFEAIDVDASVLVNFPVGVPDPEPPSPLDDHLYAVRATRSGAAP